MIQMIDTIAFVRRVPPVRMFAPLKRVQVMSRGKQKCLELHNSGLRSIAAIARAADLSESGASFILRELNDQGLIAHNARNKGAQFVEMEANKNKMLELIKDGISSVQSLVDLLNLTHNTIYRHLIALDKEGCITYLKGSKNKATIIDFIKDRLEQVA